MFLVQTTLRKKMCYITEDDKFLKKQNLLIDIHFYSMYTFLVRNYNSKIMTLIAQFNQYNIIVNSFVHLTE